MMNQRDSSTKQLLLRLVGESALIVLSVVLGLFLNEYRTSLEQRGLRRVALDNVQSEMQSNLEIVRGWLDYHRDVEARFGAALSDAASRRELIGPEGVVLWRLMPEGLVQTLPSHTAWSTLERSPIVTDVDFESLMAISRAYELQRIGAVSTVSRLKDELFSRDTVESDNLLPTLVLFHRSLQELTAQEQFLIGELEKALHEVDWQQ